MLTFTASCVVVTGVVYPLPTVVWMLLDTSVKTSAEINISRSDDRAECITVDDCSVCVDINSAVACVCSVVVLKVDVMLSDGKFGEFT